MRTIEIVTQYGFDFHKGKGQNFLVDEDVILRTLKAAQIEHEDVIIEIGPGIGTLTQYLAEASFRVIAIEIDRKLISILGRTLRSYNNIEIIQGDALQEDMLDIAQRYNAGRLPLRGAYLDGGRCNEEGKEKIRFQHPLKIVANLPYYITSPFLMRLFTEHVPVVSATIMVQKEVARRMTACPGNKDYGVLSLTSQYYSTPRVVMEISADSFLPRPKVDSAIVFLDFNNGSTVSVKDEKFFFQIIRSAFKHRRKTLVNALCGGSSPSFTRDQVKDALEKMSLDPAVRGEALSLNQFAVLSDILS